MLSNALAVTRMKAQPAVSAAADRCHEDCRELQDALDLCSIIGTDRTRSAALDFAIRVEELDRAVSEFDYHVHWISADSEDGQAEAIDSLEAVHALILGQTVGHVTEEIEQLVTLDKAVGVALDGVAAQNETWLRAARSEVLGVPE
jgi:hypothetical protein